MRHISTSDSSVSYLAVYRPGNGIAHIRCKSTLLHDHFVPLGASVGAVRVHSLVERSAQNSTLKGVVMRAFDVSTLDGANFMLPVK